MKGMKAYNTVRKISTVWFFIGMIVIGLAFLVFGYFAVTAPKQEMIETEAEIVSVEPYGEDDYLVKVKFMLDGEWNFAEHHAYDSSMKAGKKITVQYSADDVNNTYSKGSDFIPYIIMAVGGIAVVLSVVFLVKSSKKKTSDNPLNSVDVSSVPDYVIDEIKNSTESTVNYCFHFTNEGLKQGYVMEDLTKTVVYQAKMEKLTFFKPYVYEFTNNLTGYKKTYQIGHTIERSIGTGSGNFSLNIPVDKHFKIDGVNNWDYLSQKGWGLDINIHGITPEYDLLHYGVKVAHVKTTGTNAMRGGESKIGNLPVNGIYNVECRESDLDMVFMLCFIITRTFFY